MAIAGVPERVQARDDWVPGMAFEEDGGLPFPRARVASDFGPLADIHIRTRFGGLIGELGLAWRKDGEHIVQSAWLCAEGQTLVGCILLHAKQPLVPLGHLDVQL